MGPDGPVCAATLSLVVRLWSEDGTGLMLRGVVEHARTGQRCFFGTYGLLDRIKLEHRGSARGYSAQADRRPCIEARLLWSRAESRAALHRAL
jgi:hypothetical protein